MASVLVVNPLHKASRSRKVRRNPIANLGRYAKKRGSRRRRSPSRDLSVFVPERRAPIRRKRSIRKRSFSLRSVSNSSIGNIVSNSLLPAGIGAAGALATDLAWGYLPLPDNLKTGPLAPLTRIAASFGIGALAGMIGGKKFGKEVAAGALVVTSYDLLKGFLKKNTSLPLSYFPPRRPGLGYFAPARGPYLSPDAIDPEGAAFDDTLIYAGDVY